MVNTKFLHQKRPPYGSDLTAWKPIIQDINYNNLPEVVFTQAIGVGCCKIFTLEWNGTTFKDLGPNGFTDIKLTIDDFDKNGVDEIIGGANTAAYPVGLNRFGTIVFGWNESTYELVKEIFPPPTFRLQAVYDGDWEILNKEFDRAFDSYQTALNDISLESWSDARNLYEQRNCESMGATALTEPTPLLDLTEYPASPRTPIAASYSSTSCRDRKQKPHPRTKSCKKLLGTIPTPLHMWRWHPSFCEACQSADFGYDGCAAAIQYAVEHPEILVPLGSDYHGWQSHNYESADVCPFR